MSRTTLRAKGQLTLPEDIRSGARLEEGDLFEAEITPGGNLLRPQKLIDATQAWFWNSTWQAGEREADADRAAGRSEAFESGEALIVGLYGTPEQKERYLRPLLDNEIVSCFSMTEPQGGADPKVFTTQAVLDGDEWVITGEKWFSSNARFAEFLILMAVPDPDNPPYQQMSIFIVATVTPGVEIVRNVALGYIVKKMVRTHTFASTRCGFPRTTCSADGARRSSSPRLGWAAVVSTMRCARAA